MSNQLRPVAAEQRTESEVEPKAPAGPADEVQHGQTGLAVGASQPSTELLKKHQRALRGAQKQDGVDLRDIDAFVEQVDAEDHAAQAVPKVA